jgi:plastocyanin
MTRPMTRQQEIRRTLGAVALAIASGTVAVALNYDALAAQTHQITQKSRSFNPGTIEIRRGDTLSILNDDGELLHHAYVRDGGMTFDSGEQEPGTRVQIRFPSNGQYTVKCDIHPRMRLVVTVK